MKPNLQLGISGELSVGPLSKIKAKVEKLVTYYFRGWDQIENTFRD
jgi:hypothetical protein